MVRKAQSFHRMGHTDKVCYLSGMPEAFLKVDDLEIAFQKIVYSDHNKPVTINPSKQREVYSRLFDKEVITANMIIGIGSSPVEDNAMRAASKLLKFVVDEIPYASFKVINLAQLENKESRDEFFYSQLEYDLLIIHGITNDSTVERIQLCRDVIKTSEGTNRIVVVAGQDPKNFFAEKLHLTPSLVFMINGADKTVKVG